MPEPLVVGVQEAAFVVCCVGGQMPVGAVDELDRLRAEADRAEERWDQAFEARRHAQDALDLAEIENYTGEWHDDDDDGEEAALADYAARTDNPLSQGAVDAMTEKQRELFIKAGANTSGAVPSGPQWQDSNWKTGKQLER